MTPILTVGIPVHNESKYIRQTLQSLLDQPFTDFRAVVSENFSEDDSFAIIREMAAKDPRIEVIRQEKKLSAIDNFRFVMKQAHTPYFMWLGGHDLLLQDYITQGISILSEQKKVALVYPLIVPIDTAGNEMDGKPFKLNDDLDSGNLGLVERLCKVARNSFSCYANYGLMRTKSTHSIPFKKIEGTDHLILFHLATLGEVVLIQKPGIGARLHRTETHEERKTRYIREGIMDPKDKFPYENHALQYFLYILQSPTIPVGSKWTLIQKLKGIFRQKFNVSSRGLVRAGITKLLHA